MAVVVDVVGAVVVVAAARKGTFETIRVNFTEVDKNDCSPTPVALTLIFKLTTMTLTVSLALMRACHRTKLGV